MLLAIISESLALLIGMRPRMVEKIALDDPSAWLAASEGSVSSKRPVATRFCLSV